MLWTLCYQPVPRAGNAIDVTPLRSHSDKQWDIALLHFAAESLGVCESKCRTNFAVMAPAELTHIPLDEPSGVKWRVLNVKKGNESDVDRRAISIASMPVIQMVCTISRGPKKVVQLSNSHKFQSGLQSPMKLHSIQLQHVFGKHINLQLNLTKNKGGWKFNIAPGKKTWWCELSCSQWAWTTRYICSQW